MEVVFTPEALEDLAFWKASGDKKVQKKIQALLESIQATPFAGLGKPEALKHNWSGCWSRRITGEHRLIYEVAEGKIIVYQLRYHY